MVTRALLVLALLASACGKRGASERRIVVVTVSVPDGAIRLRNVRTGKLVRTLRHPCAGPPHVLPSPAGDAVFVGCDGTVHRVPLDGPVTALGQAERIGMVSGDGKLVWASVPGGFVMLHAGGGAPTPFDSAELGTPVPSADGFVAAGPVSGTLRHIRAVDEGLVIADVAVAPGVWADRPLASVVRGAPLVFARRDPDSARTWLAMLGVGGKVVDLAEGRPGADLHAVNADHAIYFGDDDRLYRVALASGAAPVMVLDERDTSHLWPNAIDLAGRLLVAEGWGDDFDDGTKSCIDLATGKIIGRFKLSGEVVRPPLIELR